MVKIRLARVGKKKQPFYRIVAADVRMPRDGRYLEWIGTYDPRAPETADKITLRVDRVQHWLGVGAQPTSTVAKLIAPHLASASE